MQKNKKKKRNLNIDYLLEEPMFYANGGSLWGNSNLNADPYAPIGQMANMAGTIGAGILDNAIEDQHQRINVNKETSMGVLKGAGQGAALGANPMLAAATGGLSIAAGAAIGGIAGGLISNKNAKKNAQENHDALIEQYYGNNPTTFAYGGPLKRKQIAVGEYPSHLNPDGSYSNEVSMSFSDDEGSWLIPTFFNGTINPQRESIERFYNTGEYLGHFKNDNDAIKGSIDREKLNQINPKGQNGYPTPRKSRDNNSLENYSSYFADGGFMQGNNQFSELNGYKHEQGGIPLAGAEVEGGEVKWKDYIFSDRLETEKGSTFASVAKRIKNKYKGRENDKLANDSMEIELTKLMKANESARLMKEEMNQASHLEDLKKYGGFVDLDGDGAIKYANGGRMEIARAARKAGLSPEKFAKHLINAKIKYADGGNLKYANGGNPWEFQQFEDSPIKLDPNNFRGTQADYLNPSTRFYNISAGLDNEFQNPIVGIPSTNNNEINYNNFINRSTPETYRTNPTVNSDLDYKYGLGDYEDFESIKELQRPNPGKIETITPKTQTFNLMPHAKQSGVDLMNRTNAPFSGVKASDQLPQRPSYEPGSLDEFLSGYNNRSTTTTPPTTLTNSNNQRGSNNFGYAEAGLVASNLAGVDNFIKSLKPAQTKFDRINLDELDLSEARLMNARNQAQGLRQSQGNIRNNASSSGQALSNLAANNAALTEQKMNADLSTYLQENQTNVGIRNQEKSVNNQIGREEYIANEQNRARAQSLGNASLANIGNNTQGYFRDKVMTKADDQQNARVQEVINSMGYNYRYGTDPATDKLFLEFISTNSANKIIGG